MHASFRCERLVEALLEVVRGPALLVIKSCPFLHAHHSPAADTCFVTQVISCAWIAHALGRRVRYDARGSDARGGDARSQSVGIPSRTADSIAGAPSAIPTPGKRTRGREFTLPDDVLVLQRHVRDGVRLTEIELPGREDKPNAARSRHNKHLQKLPGYVTYVNCTSTGCSLSMPPLLICSEFPLELQTALQELHQPTPGKLQRGKEFTLPDDVLVLQTKACSRRRATESGGDGSVRPSVGVGRRTVLWGRPVRSHVLQITSAAQSSPKLGFDSCRVNTSPFDFPVLSERR